MISEKADISKKIAEIRDLGDFCNLWPEIRCVITENALTEGKLTDEKAQLIEWLYRLADKTSTRLTE